MVDRRKDERSLALFPAESKVKAKKKKILIIEFILQSNLKKERIV